MVKSAFGKAKCTNLSLKHKESGSNTENYIRRFTVLVTDRQPDRQKDRQADRQTDRRDRQTDRQMDRQTDKQAGRQRQSDGKFWSMLGNQGQYLRSKPVSEQ